MLPLTNVNEPVYGITRGYSSTGLRFGKRDIAPGALDPQIGGTGGRILAVWSVIPVEDKTLELIRDPRTCIVLAMFQFMGGEMVIVTAGEARAPRKDIPTAARYLYLLPVSFYLVGIFLVGLCVDYRDPRLPHQHETTSLQPADQSAFIVAIHNAGLRVLPGFLNACFLFSALTAANSALYASSRTLFFMARKSEFKWVQDTIGRTNVGQTPIAAIIVSFVPGMLAFLVVKWEDPNYNEPLKVLGRFYTGPMLCVYASECLAFLRFKKG
ncbi:uncharacterized protein KY384_008627 [Bacidia gigantensis]|uniref:uncharacterized protein n=1 Tax=Bacidia gigantensis TaxID=2732470 RepID=UPI001D03E40B|nr:uncharacterized protein KY384_008627 [Bacidia gigantensis]KAG8527197.1 hypothetical protein KY384_008627 [Bacidia gigantensis]